MVVKGGADAGAPDAELRITIDATRADVGKTLPINAPASFLPDEDKPDGVAAALARFGLSHKGDGGTLLPEVVPEEAEEDAPALEPEPSLAAAPTRPAAMGTLPEAKDAGQASAAPAVRPPGKPVKKHRKAPER